MYSFEQSRAFIQRMDIQPVNEGPLSGLTFAVKDIIDIAGYKTGCGNPTWEKKHPVAACNAICIDQLLETGARCLGKTILDELAFGLVGENEFYGTPLNPKAPDRVPGGSSSGSASAVACGLVDFALGTDTGGSTRVPASNCGIFGMRPSHDTISVSGVNPLATTYDTVGILANSLATLMKVASVLLSSHIPEKIKLGKVYLLKDAFSLFDQNYVTDFPIEKLKRSFSVEECSLQEISPGSSLELWKNTYARLQWAEIWSNLGSWIEEVKPTFGSQIAVSFSLAKTVDRRLILSLCRKREEYFDQLNSFLGKDGILCIPTTPSIAPMKGSVGKDRSKDPYFQKLQSFTCIASMGRLPQINIPFLTDEGIPIGLSFLASSRNDVFLLRFIEMVLRAMD